MEPGNNQKRQAMNWKKPKKKKKKKKTGEINIGGIVGYSRGGSIIDCHDGSTKIIQADFEDYRKGKLNGINVGGIAGKAVNTEITGSTSSGKIIIYDPKKFSDLESAINELIKDPQKRADAIEALEELDESVNKGGTAEKVERLLNIINGVKDLATPFLPYLIHLSQR